MERFIQFTPGGQGILFTAGDLSVSVSGKKLIAAFSDGANSLEAEAGGGEYILSISETEANLYRDGEFSSSLPLTFSYEYRRPEICGPVKALYAGISGNQIKGD